MQIRAIIPEKDYSTICCLIEDQDGAALSVADFVRKSLIKEANAIKEGKRIIFYPEHPKSEGITYRETFESARALKVIKDFYKTDNTSEAIRLAIRNNIAENYE